MENNNLAVQGSTVALVTLTGLVVGGTTVTVPNISTYKSLYVEIVDNAGSYHEGKMIPVTIIQRYGLEMISMEYSGTNKADTYFKFTSNTSMIAYLSALSGWSSINMNIYGVK